MRLLNLRKNKVKLTVLLTQKQTKCLYLLLISWPFQVQDKTNNHLPKDINKILWKNKLNEINSIVFLGFLTLAYVIAD